MVIIEGCDNCGKTKLIEYLVSGIIVPVIRSPGPKEPGYLAAWVLIMIHLQALGPIIFDRFPVISESIYGPVLRGRDVLKDYGETTFKSLLKSTAPLIIHCRPPLSKILDWGHREQMDGVKEHITTLVDKYDYEMEMLRREGFAIVTYDFMSESLTKQEIKGMIEQYFLRRGFRV